MISLIRNFFIAVICAGYFAQNLFASPYFMGGIESVYSDSLLNVLRNPALIPSQKEAGSIGTAVKYKGYTKIDTTTEFDFGAATGEDVNSSRKKTVEGSAIISFGKRAGNAGFGIGIGSSEDEQFSLTEDETELIYYDGTGNKLTNNKTEKITRYSPVLITAFGLKLGKNTFAGLKLSFGYSLSKNEIREETIINTTALSDKSMKIRYTAYSTELGFGILHREGNSETGFIIKSGAFSLVKGKLDYEYNDTATVNGSEKIPLYRQMKKAPGIVAGSYIKLFPFLGIAVEGEYRLPAYYDDKSFNSNTFEAKTDRITVSQSFNIRGGCRFIINPLITLSAGGGFGFVDMAGETENRGRISGKIKGAFGMFGADFYISKGATVYAGVSVFRLNINYDINETGLEGSLSQDSLSVNAFLGVSKTL